MIEKAIEFATLKHANQYRKGSKIPYIVHPMQVMQILTANGFDDNTIIGGILHDTIEDTNTTYEELVEVFGEDVAKLVASESEDKSKSWKERKQKTIDMLPNESIEIQAICCADKLSNLRDIYHDYNNMGELVWNKFNAPKEDIKWYYKSIIINLTLVKEYKMHKELSKYFELVFKEKVSD